MNSLSRLFNRYSRFCIVGGSGLILDMGLIWLFTSSRVHMQLTLAKIIAAELAMINNFCWNDLWTFHGVVEQGSGPREMLSRFAKFNIICSLGIAFSVVLLNIQVGYLGLNVFVSNFICIVLVSISNFLLNLKFGWQSSRRDSGPQGNQCSY